LQIRLPAAAFIRKTIDVPGYHLGGIYGGRQRGIRIQPFACSGRGSGRVDTLAVFPSSLGCRYAAPSYPSLRPPADIHRSPALEKIRMNARVSKSSQHGRIQSTKATHSRLRQAGFLSQLGRMYTTFANRGCSGKIQ
jgi:hypothetical protein